MSELSDKDLIGQLISHAHTFGDYIAETDEYVKELLHRLDAAIKYERIECDKCQGTGLGQLLDSPLCRWCNGHGYYFRERDAKEK